MERYLKKLLPISDADFFTFVGVFLGYFVVVKLSLHFLLTYDTFPAVIWPPIGIALALYVFFGYRICIPLFLAHLLAALSVFGSLSTISFVIAASLTLQGLTSLFLLRKLGFEIEFEKVRNTLVLIFVAFTVTSIQPTLFILFQQVTNMLSTTPAQDWGHSWGGGIFSIVVFTPFILTWFPWRRALLQTRVKKLEIIAAFTVLSLMNYAIFWTDYADDLGIIVIFLLPAVFIWFSLRFHPRWLTMAVLLSSLQSVSGTIVEYAGAEFSGRLLTVEIYLGLISAIFLVFVSVVEERRLAFVRLEQAYESASASDKAKNEFIAILAHELRNPLAPIVSSLELLKSQPQNAESMEIIEGAQEHSVMIRRLLDDLLDTARLAQHKVKLKKEVVSLLQIIKQSLDSVENEAKIHFGSTIDVTLPKEDVFFIADPVRIKQIVINILNNACKYSRPNGKVSLLCKKEDSHLLIEVNDNGVGIAPEMLEKIFEPFKQLRAPSQLSTGLGIGLFLTQKLTQMHGGTIQVESEGVGKGSTFSVRIPLPEEELIAPAKEEQTKSAEHGRILVVDDNEPAANILKKLLSLHGHETSVAYSGKEALSKLKDFNPDVVILDIGMPDMDGYEVAKAMRATEWNGILIALSGYGQETDKERSLKSGFNHHLVKPVGISDINAVLAKLQLEQAHTVTVNTERSA